MFVAAFSLSRSCMFRPVRRWNICPFGASGKAAGEFPAAFSMSGMPAGSFRRPFSTSEMVAGTFPPSFPMPGIHAGTRRHAFFMSGKQAGTFRLRFPTSGMRAGDFRTRFPTSGKQPGKRRTTFSTSGIVAPHRETPFLTSKKRLRSSPVSRLANAIGYRTCVPPSPARSQRTLEGAELSVFPDKTVPSRQSAYRCRQAIAAHTIATSRVFRYRATLVCSLRIDLPSFVSEM